MDSRLDMEPGADTRTVTAEDDRALSRRRIGAETVLAATLLCAAGYFWSVGLTPRWWPIWLAALPLLWLAPKVSGWTALAMAFVARALGEQGLTHYVHVLVHMPLWLVAQVEAIPSIIFALAVVLYRGFFMRGQRWLAVLAFPSAIIAGEYLTNLSQGTYGDVAYTQFGNLPVLQLGSLAGLYGIGFAVMLFPALVAAVLLSNGTERRRFASALGVFLVCVFGFGAARLYLTPPAPHTARVGLVGSTPQNMLPHEQPNVMKLLQGYAAQVQSMAAHGATYVVTPEMAVATTPQDTAAVDALFEQTARKAGVQVLLGVLNMTADGWFNEGRLYSASGGLETVYRKHHLVPVLEGRTTPGTNLSVLAEPVGTVGVAICRDLDYPDPANEYGADKVGMLLVPAWDFDVDREYHGHISILRGVENGYSIVRVAKDGLMTVSDDRGRVLAETPIAANGAFTAMLVNVPVRHDATLYQRWGDWFAWLVLAGLVAMLVVLVAGWRTAPRSGGTSERQLL